MRWFWRCPKVIPGAGAKSIDVADLRNEKFISREHGSGTLDSLRQLLAKRKPAAR